MSTSTRTPTPTPDPGPIPPADPNKFAQHEVEPLCHELFDHVFALIRTMKKMPIKEDQFEKFREQGMKFCKKKLTRKMAQCIFNATTVQSLQTCTRP